MKKLRKNGLLKTAAPRFDNTFGTLAGTLVLQTALDMVFTARPLLSIMSMGFRELDGRVDTALLNQTITSRIHSVATVNDFGTGASAKTSTDVPIVLNQKKEVHHAFTLAEYNATDRDLIRESAEPIAIAIANHIIDSIAGLWIASKYTRSITVASGWDYDNTLRAAKKDLDDNGVPENRRFLITNSSVHDSLLGDSMFVSASNSPDNVAALTSGKLPRVLGFNIANYPALPGNSENLVAVAGTPDSSVFVARAPKNPEELAPGLKFNGNIGYIIEPRTGFQVMVNQWIDEDTLTVNNRLVWFQGFAKGNGNNLTRIKTA